MAKRKTSAALAWMLTAAMAINSGSVVWAAEDGMISVERIDAGETAEFSDSSEEISSLVNEAGENVTENEDTVTFSFRGVCKCVGRWRRRNYNYRCNCKQSGKYSERFLQTVSGSVIWRYR